MRSTISLHVLANRKLPSMKCDDDCGACCGIVPCSETERRQVERYAAEQDIKPIRQGATCPWFQGGRCAVHPVRPMLCRLFGHTAKMTCRKGYNRNAERQVGKLMQKYMAGGRQTELLHHVVYRPDEIGGLLESMKHDEQAG